MDTGHTSSVAAHDDIETQAKRLCTSIRTAVEQHKADREDVSSAQAALAAEREMMNGTQQFAETRVTLDIGGQLFAASLDTLRRVPGSMFEAMFSGRHKVSAAVDGSHFIDRDPTHFRYILNYLRTGAVTAPESAAAKLELATEACTQHARTVGRRD
jgi:hypothetical protein